jgi:hypothetical protein
VPESTPLCGVWDAGLLHAYESLSPNSNRFSIERKTIMKNSILTSFLLTCLALAIPGCAADGGGDDANEDLTTNRVVETNQKVLQGTVRIDLHVGGGFGDYCSGVYIGKGTVLTAAHCAAGIAHQLTTRNPPQAFIVWPTGALQVKQDYCPVRSAVLSTPNFRAGEAFDIMSTLFDVGILKFDETCLKGQVPKTFAISKSATDKKSFVSSFRYIFSTDLLTPRTYALKGLPPIKTRSELDAFLPYFMKTEAKTRRLEELTKSPALAPAEFATLSAEAKEWADVLWKTIESTQLTCFKPSGAAFVEGLSDDGSPVYFRDASNNPIVTSVFSHTYTGFPERVSSRKETKLFCVANLAPMSAWIARQMP